MKITTRQLATILAALRLYQTHLAMGDKEVLERFADIATDGGEYKPLSESEIDALCDQINR